MSTAPSKLSLIPATVAAMLVIAATQGCSSDTAPNEVRLRSDSLAAPASIAPSAPITVTVRVQLGGCLSFKRFDVTRTSAVLALTPIGTDASANNANVACPANIAMVRESYTAQPPFSDPLTVSVLEPDGTKLSGEVAVHQ